MMAIKAARLGRVRLMVEDPPMPGPPSAISAQLGDDEDPLEFLMMARMFLNQRIMSKDPVAVEEAWVQTSGLTKLPVSQDLAAELISIAIEQIEQGSLWKGIHTAMSLDTVLSALSWEPKRRQPKKAKEEEEPDW